MTPSDKDAILDAFAAESAQDRNTLERYIQNYPDLAEELIDVASEIRLSTEMQGKHKGTINDPKLHTAWQNFLQAAPQSQC